MARFVLAEPGTRSTRETRGKSRLDVSSTLLVRTAWSTGREGMS